MNQELLTSLRKQDDDFQLLSNGPDGAVFMTSLDIGEPLNPPPPPPALIDTSIVSINIQIARHFFAAHALFFFFIPLFGIVPFYQLVKLPLIVSITLVIASGVFVVILHAILYSQIWALYPSFILTVFNNYIFVVSLAAVGSTFAPFQGCSIMFIECTSAILLGFVFKKTIDPIWATLIMMLCGLAVWSVGLYAFINEHDWISSGLLFVICVIGYPILSGYKIYQINTNTYHSGEILRILCEYPLRGASGVILADAAASDD